MGLYSFKDWERARAEGARYHVIVCWATYLPTCPKDRVDTEHLFTCKASAERFARAIARRLPTGPAEHGVLAWVLVSSLATCEHVARERPALVYMAVDAGDDVVKRHPPCAGYYGAPRTACALGPRDTLI